MDNITIGQVRRWLKQDDTEINEDMLLELLVDIFNGDDAKDSLLAFIESEAESV